MPKLNAVDAISPAFKLTRLNLFSPYRWSFWWRIAIIGFLTGELSSGGAPNFNFPSSFPPQHRNGDQLSLIARPFPHIDPHVFWVVIPCVVIGVFLLALIFLYLGSVFRFILLEAVLNGQVSIRDAWGRWKDQGTRFFGFQLILQAIFLFLFGALVVFLLMVVGLSVLKNAGTDPSGAGVAAIMGTLFLFVGLLFLLLVPYLIVFVLAKDFAIPVMALEGTTFREAWGRVWQMVKDDTGNVLGYLGMKIVLRIGAGIIFAIIAVFAIGIFALVFGGAGLLTILAGKAAGMTWNVFTVTFAICVGLVGLAILVAIIALICAPLAMFFPAYSLYFFAGRYQPLHDRLFPPPPPAPPVIEPPQAPEPPPVPPDIPPEPAAT